MRRLITSCLLLLFAQSSHAEPLYWQVQKGGLKYIVIGSVHVGDESMYPLPQPVFNNLKNSRGLIVETDIRENRGVVYPQVTISTQDVLNQAQQKNILGLANLLELNGKDLLKMPPWAAALTIQMRQIDYLGYSAADGVDSRLMYKAALWDVPTLSLESVQFQIDLLTGQSQAGKEMLVSILDEFDHSEDAMRCLITSWKSGDIEKLNEFASLTKMSPEFEHAFLTTRNVDWAKKLSDPQWLPEQTGTYVVIVGTLHLIGQQSVLALLAADGFKVKQLSNSEPARCEFKF